MTDQHLFYALAKARRGEYPDSHARATGIEALELEAFRRLRNKLVVPTVDSTAMKRKPLDCAFCHGHFVHYAHCPTLLH